jgi:membrane protein YdbS with pleckstrin-like domain
MDARTYPSRVDRWLVVLLVALPITAIAPLASLNAEASRSDVAWAIGGAAFVILLYVTLVIPVRYTIDEAQLTIRYGVVRQRIPLSRIVKVARTRNPLSAPALSLDRLQVTFGGGLDFALISPHDQEAFLTHLCQAAGLVRSGTTLTRPIPRPA